MSRTAFKTLSVLNFDSISEEQLTRFDRLFDENCKREMLSINYLDEDPVRQKLDRSILDILGVDIDLDMMYGLLANEQQFDRNDAKVT